MEVEGRGEEIIAIFFGVLWYQRLSIVIHQILIVNGVEKIELLKSDPYP